MDEVEAQQDFDDFFEEVFCELEDKVINHVCFQLYQPDKHVELQQAKNVHGLRNSKII